MLVGDRGMITEAHVSEDMSSAGLDWITALRAPAIKALVGGGHLQLSLLDQRDMGGITSPDFPGERLMVCRNPDLAAERARKRGDLLAATERDLAKSRPRWPASGGAARHRGDRDRDRRGHRQAQGGQALRSKHRRRRFQLLPQGRRIAARGSADGIYVVRTSVPAATLDTRGEGLQILGR